MRIVSTTNFDNQICIQLVKHTSEERGGVYGVRLTNPAGVFEFECTNLIAARDTFIAIVNSIVPSQGVQQ